MELNYLRCTSFFQIQAPSSWQHDLSLVDKYDSIKNKQTSAIYKLNVYIYMVSCPVLTDPPPMVWGGVGTRIRYTRCISTLCRLSTLPQYYKPPPHHRGGWGILYTTTIPQTTPTPQGGGNPLLPPPMGGEGGGTGQHCTIYIHQSSTYNI